MRPCLCETGRTARRCHEASVIRSMSGNGSVRKKLDLIWSVVSSSGDSALECDRECVQGWFRALCLSNTSRTPPRSGLSDKRKGSTRHLGVRRDRLGWFTSTQPPGARRRGLHSGLAPKPLATDCTLRRLPVRWPIPAGSNGLAFPVAAPRAMAPGVCQSWCAGLRGARLVGYAPPAGHQAARKGADSPDECVRPTLPCALKAHRRFSPTAGRQDGETVLSRPMVDTPP
jgi:hypothetical protein